MIRVSFEQYGHSAMVFKNGRPTADLKPTLPIDGRQSIADRATIDRTIVDRRVG